MGLRRLSRFSGGAFRFTSLVCAAALMAGELSGAGFRVFAADASTAASGFPAPLGAARAVVAACAATASGCDPAALPIDSQLRAADGRGFRASWTWLREAVGKAKESSAGERAETMRQARGQLDEMALEAGERPSTLRAEVFDRAKPVLANILAQGEFQADAGPTWLDRQIARLQDWFLRLLLGMDRVGTHNPWIAPLVEWTCFLLAAGGLLFFVRRSLARQALRIALGEGAGRVQFGGRDATDWAQLAKVSGSAGDWRAGVHHLYWAAIVSLEGRRAWRPNPTRTPREYLRLLPPGLQAQRALQQLTRLFEQVWYGHETANEAAFRAAEVSFEAIRTAEVPRNGAERPRSDAGTATVGAA